MCIYLLSDTFHEGVVNLPQIKITYTDIDLDLSSYQALIFSSKNAVKAIDKINNEWKKIPSFVIGKPTAKTVESLGGIVEYISNSSYGDDFAKEIIEKLKKKKVIFLRAKKVLSNLESILLNGGINLSSYIVYETTCNTKIKLDICDEPHVFIFTSPSTVECFFKNYEWKQNYLAVCIGNVTKKAFPIDTHVHVSTNQTIEDCIELAKTLIKQS